MELVSLTMKNFLSIGEKSETISFDKLTTIVGPNESGKTNIFRALAFVNDCLNTNTSNPDPYYHNGDLTKDLEVKLSMKLNDNEISGLANYIFCSILSDTQPLNRFEMTQSAISLIETFLHHHSKTIAEDLFRYITIVIRRTEARSIYQGDIIVKLGKDEDLYLKQYSRITKDITTQQGGKNISEVIVSVIQKKNPDAVNDFLKDTSKPFPEFSFSKEEIIDFFKKIDPDDKMVTYDFRSFNFGEGNIREKNYPEAILLLEFLRNMGAEERGVSLLPIISKIVSSSIVRVTDLRTKPQAFLSFKNTFPYKSISMNDLSGESLPEILFKLKNSPYPHIRKAYNKIQTSFRKMCNNLDFEIGIRPVELTVGTNTKKTSIGPEYVKTNDGTTIENELVIHFIRDNVSIPLEFSAAGIFEILLLLTALIGQKGKVILLDEPAVNLHPLLQRKVIELIESEIAQDNDNQIIIITHSPYMINPRNIENIWRISRTNNEVMFINVGEALDELSESEKQKILLNLQSTDIRSVLFSKGVILVEGPSDKLVIEQVDRFLSSKDKGACINDNDWYVLDIVGKHSLWAYLKMVTKLRLSFVSVMDYDALMYCDKNEAIKDQNIPVSAIPRALYNVKLLSDKQIDDLIQMAKNVKDGWYPDNEHEILNSMAKTNGIFVFTQDLEGVLQQQVKRKESKPLKDLNLVLEKITEDKLPQEFELMSKFIKERMVL